MVKFKFDALNHDSPNQKAYLDGMADGLENLRANQVKNARKSNAGVEDERARRVDAVMGVEGLDGNTPAKLASRLLVEHLELWDSPDAFQTWWYNNRKKIFTTDPDGKPEG